MKEVLADRMRLLIDARADRRGKFAQLEELTSIPAENWKSFYYARQRPNPDMIEAICQTWPEHALWLATGITDSAHGQIGVPQAYMIEVNLSEKPDQMSCIQYVRRKAEIYKTMIAEDRTLLTKGEFDELYDLRCARDTERLGYITRRSATKEGKVAAYFDPRQLRHHNMNETEEGPDDDGDQ